MLHYAAEDGKLSIVQWYMENLEGDKNPPIKSNDDKLKGRTPLHWAALRGDIEMYKVISDLLKDKNPGDGHNVTPFHLATQKGKLPLIEYLTPYLLDIDVRTDDFWGSRTPLHVASQFGHLEIVKFLIKNGADPQLKSNSGLTAYEYAIQDGNSHVAEYLKGIQ